MSLAQVGARIGIATKHLRALEWDRFDLLPPRRARRIVSAYAELLEIDPEPYLAHMETAQPTRRRFRVVRLVAAVMVVLAAIAAVVVKHLPGFSSPAGAKSTSIARPKSTTSGAASLRPSRSRVGVPPSAPVSDLAIRAAGGDCWLLVRRGDSNVPVYVGVLREGTSAEFKASRLIVTLGAAGNVDLMLNDRRIGPFYGTIQLAVAAGIVRTSAGT